MVEKEKKKEVIFGREVINNRFGFGINDCPLWLFKRIDKEAKALYNDYYWVVLVEWLRKADAYDSMTEAPQPMIQEEEEKEESKTISVLGKEPATAR